MEENLEEQLTLFAEDTLANPLALQENKKGKRTLATSGLKCSALSEKLNQDGLLPKMLKGILDSVWTPYSMTWKLRITPAGRSLYQLARLAHRTKEIGSGLLPTPQASDATTGAIIGKDDQFYMTKTGMPRKINRNGKDGSVGLARLMILLPTLRASKIEGYASSNYSPTLHQMLLPTCSANEHKGSSKKRYLGSPHFRGAKTSEALRNCETDKIYLNPSFAEAMMGFPKGWTDLKA